MLQRSTWLWLLPHRVLPPKPFCIPYQLPRLLACPRARQELHKHFQVLTRVWTENSQFVSTSLFPSSLPLLSCVALCTSGFFRRSQHLKVDMLLNHCPQLLRCCSLPGQIESWDLRYMLHFTRLLLKAEELPARIDSEMEGLGGEAWSMVCHWAHCWPVHLRSTHHRPQIWISFPLTSHRAVTVRQDRGGSRVCLARKETKGLEDSPGCQDPSDCRWARIFSSYIHTHQSVAFSPTL